MVLTCVTWALVGLHKNEIGNMCHMYGREFSKLYILKILDGLMISSNTWHNLNG
jgi:hypothetical protein